MKINGQISILCSHDRVVIEVTDHTSGTQFLDLELSPVAFASALGRLCNVPCRKAEVRNLENVGKIAERIQFSVRIPQSTGYKDRNEVAIKKLVEEASEKHPGWTVDTYLGSQGSFQLDGKDYIVNASLFRYIDVTKNIRDKDFKEQQDYMEEMKNESTR